MAQVVLSWYYSNMRNRGLTIVSVAGRITVFLFIFTVFTVCLYVLGSFQSFTDESLIYLLITAKYSSIVFIAFAYAYIPVLLIAGRGTGRRIVRRVIITIAGSIPAIAVFIIMQLILSALEPV